MIDECQVSVVSEVSKFEEKDLLLINSNQNYEKQTVDEEEVGEDSISIDDQNENQTVDEEVSEDSISIDDQNEKQTVDENSIINEEQTVDEEVNGNFDINTQIEKEEEGSEEEGNAKLDWMKEFPPLQSRGVQVSSANSVVEKDISTRNWVSALKKSHSPRPRPRPIGVKVIKGENLQTLKKELEVGKKYACSKNGETLDQVEKFMKVYDENNKFHNGYVKDNAKSTVRRFGTLEQENRVKSVDEGLARKPKEMRRQEVDFKQDATIKVEETERKEQKLEEVEAIEARETSEAEVGGEVKAQMEAQKREKRRQKKLRLKERKKAAKDGRSLDQNPELKQEKAEIQEADLPIKVLKDQDQHEKSSLEQEDELKECVQNKSEKDEAEVRMLQQEEVEANEMKDEAAESEDELKLHQENDGDDQMLEKIQLNVQQQETETKEAMMAQMRAELQAKLEAQQMKQKKKEKNLARKARKKAKAARNKNMKWILVITFILFTLSCLTIFYIF